jgi:hypothetical protein
MRIVKLIFAFLFLLIFQLGWSQKTGQSDFELGLMGGISWYNGDLNTNKFFDKNYSHQAFGVSLRKNLNQRFALRAQLNKGTLSAQDKNATSTFQLWRNLGFSTDIYELATTIEFNFLEYDALNPKFPFSPYTFIGMAGFYFNPTTDVEGNYYELQPLATEGKSYSRISFAIPFGFGFKWAITDRFIANVDWGIRRTFTDYIDDVSSTYPTESELLGLSKNVSDRSLEQSGPNGTNWGTQRGNAKQKDWYSFALAGLSIRLGPKKGSCKHIRI